MLPFTACLTPLMSRRGGVVGKALTGHQKMCLLTCVPLSHLASWAFSFLICKMGGCLPVLPLYDQKLKKNGLLYIASKILEYTLPRD